MSLSAGTRLGPYEILAPVGAGGMGEVWRARDTRLGREVAVKVLPERLATDAEALGRFEREARAVASLSHPNILAIHDFGREGEVVYSVTEMVAGETLRQRLAGGALPVRKALDYAQQIARGLAAAQDRGVVHRDLKPENIIITPDGAVKILDFGLAKLAPSEQDGLTGTPTRQAGTAPGKVMGTMGYMSPEQVRGQEVDHRTDIFALGAVLYEMLSGRPAFRRDTPADTVSAILKEDPPAMSSTNRPISPQVERIVHHCLEKNPAERFQSARDLGFNLEAVAGTQTGSGASGADIGLPHGVVAGSRHGFPGRAGAVGLGVAIGLLAGLATGWLGAGYSRQPVTYAPPSMRTLTYSGVDREPSAAPGGRLIAYASERDGGTQIWLKQHPGGDEVALTHGAIDAVPRISPDGSQVLFVRQEGTERSLYRVPVVGGEPRKVLDDVWEADWSPDGSRIVIARNRISGGASTDFVLIVDAAGQDAREIARLDNISLSSPRWSPDGTTIALVQTGTENSDSTLLLVNVADGSKRVLSPPPPLGRLSALVWIGSGGSLLYTKSETIVVGQTAASSSQVVLQDVVSGEARSLMWLPSATGSLDVVGPGAIVLGSGYLRQNLREITLDGASAGSEGRWLTRGNSMDRQPVFSPDGKWVLFSSNRSGNLDLWKLSTETGAIRRITEDQADDWDPAFTPDGRNILWSSNRSGHFEIWMCAADGTGARQISQDGYDAENPTSTPDGAWIVYNSANPAHTGIWKMRVDGTQATRVVPGSWSTPDTSPDGKYVAYRTGSQLRTLHVARLSDGGAAMPPKPLSGTNLNGRPRWMPDGKSLLFIGENDAGRRGIYIQRFEPGQDTSSARRPLLGFELGDFPESMGVSPDGRRLIYSSAENQESLVLAEGLAGVEPPTRLGSAGRMAQ